ncbi:B4 protein, partial [Jacana jacana]|nr:B4 protein [Jacana jacana]
VVSLPAAEAAGTAQLPGLVAKRWCPSHPSTLCMVIEALQAQDEKKGTSVFAMKRFILTKYPTVNPNRLRYLLKQALNKGLSQGVLMRPRNSTAVGATGRFKVSRGYWPQSGGAGVCGATWPHFHLLLPTVSPQESAAQAATGPGGT